MKEGFLVLEFSEGFMIFLKKGQKVSKFPVIRFSTFQENTEKSLIFMSVMKLELTHPKKEPKNFRLTVYRSLDVHKF